MTTWAPAAAPTWTPTWVSISNWNFSRFDANPNYFNSIPWLRDLMSRFSQIKNEIDNKKASIQVPRWFLSRASINSANAKIERSIKELETESLNIKKEIKAFLEAELTKNIWADDPATLKTKTESIINEKWTLEVDMAKLKAEKELCDGKIADIRALNKIQAEKLKEHTDLEAKKLSLPVDIRNKNAEIAKLKTDISDLENDLHTANASSSRAIWSQLDTKEADLKKAESDLVFLEWELRSIDPRQNSIMTDIWNQIQTILWRPGMPADLAKYLQDMENKSNDLQQKIAPIQAKIWHQDTQKWEIERQWKVHETNNPNTVAIRSALTAINADINTLTPVVTGKKTIGQRLKNLRKS